MSVNQIIFLLFFLGFGMTVFAQKIERETKINEENAPVKAIEFINDVQNKKHVKWFSEKTSGRRSYESKFKHKGSYYSVEFDTLGKIEDIEVIVKLKNLDQEHKKAIKSGILKEFEKFKWIKIQKQFTGEKKELRKVFLGTTENVELNYEVEVEVKTKLGAWKMYEILINPEGEIQKMREILLRPTDSLNY